MCAVGIERIGMYWPGLCMRTRDLALERGIPIEKVINGLGVHSFAVPCPFEDAVTMAACALEDMFDYPEGGQKGGSDNLATSLEEVGRLVVATESATDCSKPVAAWLHGLFPFRSDCEVFDVKFACLGGVYALIDALRFVQASAQKAVVVMADVAIYGRGGSAEMTQGAGACALLISSSPDLLAIDVDVTGTYTRDTNEFHRPLHQFEAVVKGRKSVQCYFEALAAIFDYQEKAGKGSLFGASGGFDALVFHTPYPALPLKALDRVLEREGVGSDTAAKLRGALEYSLAPARLAGNSYTASVFLALASLLAYWPGATRGCRIGMFHYGSGSSAKFVAGTVNCPPESSARLAGRLDALNYLHPLTVDEMEAILYERILPWKELPVPGSPWRISAIDDWGYRSYARLRPALTPVSASRR